MNANVMQKGTHMSVHIYRLTLSKRVLLTGHQSYNTSSRPPSSFARPRLHRRTPSPSSSPALAFVSAHPRPRPSPPSPTQFLLPTPPPPPPRRLAPKGQRAARKAVAPTRAKQWARGRDMEGEKRLQYFLHQRGITVAARGARLSKAGGKGKLALFRPG